MTVKTSVLRNIEGSMIWSFLQWKKYNMISWQMNTSASLWISVWSHVTAVCCTANFYLKNVRWYFNQRTFMCDPFSPPSAVKYELPGCYETCSLWLNLQWGPPLPPLPPIRSSHNAAWKMRQAWQLRKHPPCDRPPLTASSFQLSFERGCKCVHQAWLCVRECWAW